MAHMRADHSPVEDVGRIAEEAGVKTLVLSHLTPAVDSITDDTWRAPAAKSFKGEIFVAKDLMVLSVCRSEPSLIARLVTARNVRFGSLAAARPN